MSDPVLTRRFKICTRLVLAAMVALAGRLAFLHLGPHDELRTQIERNRSVTKPLLAGRGCILDCGGADNVLALSMDVKDVCLDPKVVVETTNTQVATALLAGTLQLSSNSVAALLSNPRDRFACVRRSVPPSLAGVIEARKVPGVKCEDASLRHYPQGHFMCHVLGFVNRAGEGSTGVELLMDKYLRGSGGLEERRLNATRHRVYGTDGQRIPALPGADVELTIDQNVQYFTERALDEVMAEHAPKAVWAMVQRVRTGEILAMACRPAFDLNAYTEVDKELWRNQALATVYEPGSTFKAVVFSAALNEHTVTPETLFDCENGAWSYGGRVLRDYHPYGVLTVADGIKKSSNIMSAKIALGLGDRRLFNYLQAYQIGSKLGLDLPGEEKGLLQPPARWSAISGTRIAIGQGVAVTAVQMLGLYGAIANDGCLMRPYVVRRVVARDGTILAQPLPEVVSRPITPATAALMRRLLARVTEDGGTGERACVEGYQVAGKTGTAQKAIPGGYSDTAYISSFVGFIPAETPEIAAVVVVDEPQPYHTGGRVAAPAFSRILSDTVRYLDVPPVRRTVAGRTGGGGGR